MDTRIKTKAALISVVSNLFLMTGKLIVGIMIGSISVISEAIHSANDLVASFIALFAVKEASKPPDAKHPFGHGKIENISGTIEALLIFLAAALIIKEAVGKIRWGGEMLEPTWGLAIMGVSAALNFAVSNYLLRIGREHHSIALEADGMHLRTDVYTSLGVFIGLLLIKITGLHIIDPIAAILVALLIIKAAYDLTRKAFMPLLDTALEEHYIEAVQYVLEQHNYRYLEYHDLRTRRSGREAHIDLHLVIDANTSVQEAHDLCDSIEKSICDRIPFSSVLIHVEPNTEVKQLRG
ncbi:MAG: cation diffusion facilitator family transporter [Syntrophomonadaceae bacterium]